MPDGEPPKTGMRRSGPTSTSVLSEVTITGGRMTGRTDDLELAALATQFDLAVAKAAPSTSDRRVTVIESAAASEQDRAVGTDHRWETLITCPLLQPGLHANPLVWGARKPTPELLSRELHSTGLPTLERDHDALTVAESLPNRRSGAVVMEPLLAAALLHACVGHTVEADNYVEYGEDLGIAIGDQWSTHRELHVLDDPTEPGHSGSYEVDDEGSAARSTTLIESGRWESLLTSCQHGPTLGHGLTGNGRRARGASRITPRNSILRALPGADEPTSIVESIDDGFYCGGPRRSGSMREFVRIEIAWARRVRRGQLTGEVFRDVELRARKGDILRRLYAIGNDVTLFDNFWPCEKDGENIYTTLGAPHLGFRSLVLYPSTPGQGPR